MRAELERAGVGFTVVVLPDRTALDGTAGPRTESPSVRAAVLQCLDREDIRALDAWRFFEERWAEEPAAPLFKRDHRNPHFEVQGHAEYAAWLDAQLGH